MTAGPLQEGGPLKVSVMPNGPLMIEGAFTITDETDAVVFSGQRTTLCRCGGSSKKPFCDGTHKTNGFTGE
jgi:CDGSH-type Zn-finger protein